MTAVFKSKISKALDTMKRNDYSKINSTNGDADDGFLSLVNKIRAKAENNPPSLDEITKEVELVRAKRYAKSKR